MRNWNQLYQDQPICPRCQGAKVLRDIPQDAQGHDCKDAEGNLVVLTVPCYACSGTGRKCLKRKG